MEQIKITPEPSARYISIASTVELEEPFRLGVVESALGPQMRKLREELERIPGVNYCSVGRYDARLEIAELFDIEDVVDAVSEAVLRVVLQRNASDAAPINVVIPGRTDA